ncbi:MAG: SUMF1/EgtB/PvdO family nonheme iron enzyme [Prochloraceae cyanobacterium]
MKLESIRSLREDLNIALKKCRRNTLELLAKVDPQSFCTQAHPDFSPVGWHFGHIASIESYWILEKYARIAPIYPEYRQLFAADGLPKYQRQHLPAQEVIQDYLDRVRKEVLTYLEIAPIKKEERLWRWLLQHETQHNETINLVLQLLRSRSDRGNITLNFPNDSPSIKRSIASEMVKIPAGKFKIGNNSIEAMDNEKPAQIIHLDSYYLDRYPVTCKQYGQFMAAGGYQNRQWWSDEGWQWLSLNPVSQPLYWSNSSDWDNYPVCGVSYYEARAYANYLGKRLPTEAEWEKAATYNPHTQTKQIYPWGNEPPSAKTCNHNTIVGHTTPVNAHPLGKSPIGCYDMLGNVWEWTASIFQPYSGFKSYPYRGYSRVYFDNQHYVLRGGSWATLTWGLRSTFRNWYHPHVRQILSGFRCAV